MNNPEMKALVAGEWTTITYLYLARFTRAVVNTLAL